MRIISKRIDQILSTREGAAEPQEQIEKYIGGRSMNTGTICELMIALLYLIKIIFH